MNQDGTPIEAPEGVEVKEVSTDNIPASEGGETATPDEVAKILNLPNEPKADEDVEEDTDVVEEEDGGEVTPPAPKDPVEPPAPEAKPTEPPADEDEDAPKFELEIEDANGEKLILKPGDNIEDVLKDFEPKSNGQIFQIIKDSMQLDQDKAKYDADQEIKSEEAQIMQAAKEIGEVWDKEITTLQGSKRLPVGTDGKPSERLNQVYEFIASENARRQENGVPPIRSIEDALDKLELREAKEQAKEQEKTDKETARKKGAMVGGSSAPASSGSPTYKGGARNANEALRGLGIL